MSETKTEQLAVFLDTVGRTIIGKVVKDTKSELTIKDGVIFNLLQGQNPGEIGTQFVPLFFKEFLADPSETVEFVFQKATIVLSNVKAIDHRLTAQYAQLFNPNNAFVPAGTVASQATPALPTGPRIVNLHDE